MVKPLIWALAGIFRIVAYEEKYADSDIAIIPMYKPASVFAKFVAQFVFLYKATIAMNDTAIIARLTHNAASFNPNKSSCNDEARS